MPRLTEQQQLLILDLDETLIYATEHPLAGRSVDFYADQYAVYKRPGLDDFLNNLKQQPERYALMVWTTGNACYAEHLAKQMGLDGHLIALWNRPQCSKIASNNPGQQYHFLKDMAKIRRSFHCSRSRVIAIDNTLFVYQRSYANVLPIPSFEGTEVDGFSLALVTQYLQKLQSIPDVRVPNKRQWWTNPLFLSKAS